MLLPHILVGHFSVVVQISTERVPEAERLHVCFSAHTFPTSFRVGLPGLFVFYSRLKTAVKIC